MGRALFRGDDPTVDGRSAGAAASHHLQGVARIPVCGEMYLDTGRVGPKGGHSTLEVSIYSGFDDSGKKRAAVKQTPSLRRSTLFSKGAGTCTTILGGG